MNELTASHTHTKYVPQVQSKLQGGFCFLFNIPMYWKISEKVRHGKVAHEKVAD